MRVLALLREVSARMLVAAIATMLAPAAGFAQAVQPQHQADPPQSRSLLELSQQGQRDASRGPVAVPRVAAAQGKADTRPIVKLKTVTVEGARAISPTLLADTYRPYIGKRVSQADLINLAADVSQAYRSAGYHLSRAIIPPQDIAGGRLRVRVIEGSITDVAVKGDDSGRFGIGAMLAPLTAERPSRLRTLERQLLLVNDVPGVRIADTTLDEIGTGSGRFRLVVTVRTWGLYSAAGVDNLGSTSIGPWQVYNSTTLNSLARPGDAFTANMSAAPDHHEIAYGSVSYDAPIGVDGIRFGAAAWHSTTWPGDERREFNTRGDSSAAEVRASMMAYVTQTTSLRLTAAAGAGEFSDRDEFGLSYRDHVRTLRYTADLFQKDPFGGKNYLSVGFRQGFEGLGASSADDLLTSRPGASGTFSVLEAGFTRYQAITDAWSMRVAGAAQFASGPLFLSQQFSLGGAAFGRGYDAAFITGDNGVGGLAELRFDQKLPWALVHGLQLYGFVDGGAVWDTDEIGRRSLVSAGLGFRLAIADDWQAGAAVAFPLVTSNVDLDSHAARLLFSVTKTLKACPSRVQFWCS